MFRFFFDLLYASGTVMVRWWIRCRVKILLYTTGSVRLVWTGILLPWMWELGDTECNYEIQIDGLWKILTSLKRKHNLTKESLSIALQFKRKFQVNITSTIISKYLYIYILVQIFYRKIGISLPLWQSDSDYAYIYYIVYFC